MIQQQEIEVKIQLESRHDYERFAAYMKEPKRTIHQHNVFLDGSNREISKQRAAFRIRFNISKTYETCVLTHKRSIVLQNGVSSSDETEEEVDAMLGESAIKNPHELMEWKGELIESIRNRYGMSSFINLGGFKTLRKKYDWSGVELELDETVYTFGTRYEIEVETDEPMEVKQKLCQLLNELGVHYHDSKTTKFEDLLNESVSR